MPGKAQSDHLEPYRDVSHGGQQKELLSLFPYMGTHVVYRVDRTSQGGGSTFERGGSLEGFRR